MGTSFAETHAWPSAGVLEPSVDGVTDRGGDKRFYEVYPAGSLSQRGLTSRGYKKNTPDHKEARETISGGLRQKMPWLIVPDTCATAGDGLDALIASLTARAATQGRTPTTRHT